MLQIPVVIWSLLETGCGSLAASLLSNHMISAKRDELEHKHFFFLMQRFTGIVPIIARIPWMKLVHFLFRVLKYSLSNYGSASLHLTKLEV